MRAVAFVLAAMVAASPAAAWSPPAGHPSAAAQRVLDSLPDPRRVPLPAGWPPRAAASPARPAPVQPASPESAGANSAACFEVQLVATGDAERARALAQAARSDLGVAVRVIEAGGLHRLRAGGCLDTDAARRLRERARERGYDGAFVLPSGGSLPGS